MAQHSFRRSLLRMFLEGLPALSVLCLVFVGAAPVGARYWAEIGPLLPLLAVYFWSSDASNLLPFWFVFLVGVLIDILMGGPLGLSALLLLLISGAASTQMRVFAGKPFYLPWFGLVVISFIALFVKYIIATIYHFSLLDPTVIVGQWVMCILLYPAMALMLGVLRLRINIEIEEAT